MIIDTVFGGCYCLDDDVSSKALYDSVNTVLLADMALGWTRGSSSQKQTSLA